MGDHGLALLPGEREVLRLRPSALGWAPRYLVAALPGIWGLALLLVTSQPSWRGGQAAAYAFAAGGLVVFGLLGSAFTRTGLPFALAVVAWVGSILMGILAQGKAGVVLPLYLAALSVALLALAELSRRSLHLHATNVRFALRCTFPRRWESSARHAELADIDLRQGPLGRALDLGALAFVPQPAEGSPALSAAQADAQGGPLRWPRVRPARRVLTLAQVLVQQATATEYLRETQALDRRQADALAALQRR